MINLSFLDLKRPSSENLFTHTLYLHIKYDQLKRDLLKLNLFKSLNLYDTTCLI